MDQKTRIMQRLKRASGMSLAAREHLKKELHNRQWWTKCWNCRKDVEGTLTDLSATCPHCGVILSERKGVRAVDTRPRKAFRYDPQTRKLIDDGSEG